MCASFTATTWADPIIDNANDFLPSYTGPHNGDLDVLSAQVFFDGSNFTFTDTQNGTIGTTPTGLYVWGIDRGSGTQGFPVIAPGVTFDSVFIINPSGTSSVRDLVSNAATTITDISVSGSTITGRVPLSALPSRGLDPTQYKVNLWPRSGAGGDPAVADFAPDNSVAAVTNVATPEPASMLFVGGALTAGILLRRRRHSYQSRS